MHNKRIRYAYKVSYQTIMLIKNFFNFNNIMTVYYFTAASKHFLLEEEPVEEILRERRNFYQTNNLPIDFWLISHASFFQLSEVSSLKKFVNQDLAAVVSTNPHFINWLKLRLQYVIIGNFDADQDLISKNLKMER